MLPSMTTNGSPHAMAATDDHAAALASWLEHYNTQWRHATLDGHPSPNSCLSPP